MSGYLKPFILDPVPNEILSTALLIRNAAVVQLQFVAYYGGEKALMSVPLPQLFSLVDVPFFERNNDVRRFCDFFCLPLRVRSVPLF